MLKWHARYCVVSRKTLPFGTDRYILNTILILIHTLCTNIYPLFIVCIKLAVFGLRMTGRGNELEAKNSSSESDEENALKKKDDLLERLEGGGSMLARQASFRRSVEAAVKAQHPAPHPSSPKSPDTSTVIDINDIHSPPTAATPASLEEGGLSVVDVSNVGSTEAETNSSIGAIKSDKDKHTSMDKSGASSPPRSGLKKKNSTPQADTSKLHTGKESGLSKYLQKTIDKQLNIGGRPVNGMSLTYLFCLYDAYESF
jgi:hypothetical protein